MEIMKSEPLHLQSYHIIKSQLLEGDYEPGERLVEVKLAKKLGVSRGPIREAIRMLIQDGLVVQHDGRLLVYQPTMKDLVDVFQCRESLEILSVRLAARNVTPKQLEALTNNIEQSRNALTHSRTKESGQLDREFHDLIMEASQNHELIKMMDVINAKITHMRNGIIRQSSNQVLELVEDHESILQALQDQDEVQAENHMLTHIQRSRKVFEDVLINNGG